MKILVVPFAIVFIQLASSCRSESIGKLFPCFCPKPLNLSELISVDRDGSKLTETPTVLYSAENLLLPGPGSVPLPPVGHPPPPSRPINVPVSQNPTPSNGAAVPKKGSKKQGPSPNAKPQSYLSTGPRNPKQPEPDNSGASMKVTPGSRDPAPSSLIEHGPAPWFRARAPLIIESEKIFDVGWALEEFYDDAHIEIFKYTANEKKRPDAGPKFSVVAVHPSKRSLKLDEERVEGFFQIYVTLSKKGSDQERKGNTFIYFTNNDRSIDIDGFQTNGGPGARWTAVHGATSYGLRWIDSTNYRLDDADLDATKLEYPITIPVIYSTKIEVWLMAFNGAQFISWGKLAINWE